MNVLRLLGFASIAVAVLGLFLPLLPTTPFVLLATACFARSSEKWHRWMLANDTFGPMIRNWETHRCVSIRVKLIAILSMAGVGGYSIVVAIESAWLRVAGAVLIVIGLIVIGRLRTCPRT
jgi:uncharacterized membrane protein YbaN (DUF454 family)